MLLPLHCADQSTLSQLDYTALSEQAIMELLVAQTPFKAELCDDSGSFKDIDEWDGVSRGPEGNVEAIEWANKDCSGIDFRWLPLHLSDLELSDCPIGGSLPAFTVELEKLCLQDCGLSGTVQWEALPHSLQWLYLDENDLSGEISFAHFGCAATAIDLSNNALTGGIDLRALPENLKTLTLCNNELSGYLDLTHLPTHMQHINLASNAFTGEVDLTALPHGLRDIRLSKNALSGTICLSALPDSLMHCALGKNLFTGGISLDELPPDIRSLSLAGCRFDGEIRAAGIPQSMRSLDLSECRFTGVAVLPDVLSPHLHDIDLNGNALEGVVHANGTPLDDDRVQMALTEE